MNTTCDADPTLQEKYAKLQAELRQTCRELRNCQAKLRLKRNENQFISRRQATEFVHKSSKKITALNSLNEELQDQLALADHRQHELKMQIASLEAGETHVRMMESLIEEAGLAPVLAAADKVEEMNREIMKVADFLASNVRHMVHEVFQEEIDRSYENCQRTLGPVLADLILNATQEGADETVPSDNFIVQVVAQIFMVVFCLSHLDACDVINGAGAYVEYKSWDQLIVNPPSRNDLKSKFLQGLTDIFKVASWAILGKETRDAFEEVLLPFLDALDSLNATGHILHDASFFLCTADPNRPFLHMMYSEIPFDVPKTDMEDTQYVAGTMTLGLRKKLPYTQDNDEARFKTLLSTQVVLYSTLEEKYGLEVPEDILAAYLEPLAEDDQTMNEAVESKPEAEFLSPQDSGTL